MKDFILPAGILLLIGSMLVPLPDLVIDFFLSANLLIALVLLLSAFYITEPLKLSSLPTMLLLAAMFRLALNVSTTRLILGKGQAGAAIEAFGTVVIGESLVVGVVVFLVISLIQFIVIAKGSERVAEVAARFTLDALPGRQMAIDADVRSGLFDLEAARSKRQELQTESRFYGALDGAMKFVKGDAIAGLLIAGVNIVGGFFAGVFLLNLELGQAIQKFTVLTVGDGLLSQIPALLNSLTAGIVVTRVSKGDGSSLTKELVDQFSQIRPARIMIGIAALGLGLVSGMPTLPFLCLALLLILPAIKIRPRKMDQAKHELRKKFVAQTPPVLELLVSIEIAKSLHQSAQLELRIEEFKETIFRNKGLLLATPSLTLVPNLHFGWILKSRGIQIAAGSETKAEEPKAQEIVISILSAMSTLVESRAHEFVDDIMTRRILDNLDTQAPELVSAAVPATISVTQLTEILRELVRDKISICNLDLILQAIAEKGSNASSNSFILLEHVRQMLARVICSELKNSDGSIATFNLDPATEAQAIVDLKEGNLLHSPLFTCLKAELDTQLKLLGANGPRVLVVAQDLRRLMNEYFRSQHVSLHVLSWAELADDVKIKTIALLAEKKVMIDSGSVAV